MIRIISFLYTAKLAKSMTFSEIGLLKMNILNKVNCNSRWKKTITKKMREDQLLAKAVLQNNQFCIYRTDHL